MPGILMPAACATFTGSTLGFIGGPVKPLDAIFRIHKWLLIFLKVAETCSECHSSRLEIVVIDYKVIRGAESEFDSSTMSTKSQLTHANVSLAPLRLPGSVSAHNCLFSAQRAVCHLLPLCPRVLTSLSVRCLLIQLVRDGKTTTEKQSGESEAESVLLTVWTQNATRCIQGCGTF